VASDSIRALATGAAATAVLSVAAGFALVRANDHPPAVGPELATYMGELQHQTHKLNLSIEAENPKLADFYLDEVGEVADQIERLFPQHEGVPVGELARAMLDPPLHSLHGAIESERWDEARTGMSGLVASCNACHAAAGHGFIEVEVTKTNPFNQSFAAPGAKPRP